MPAETHLQFTPALVEVLAAINIELDSLAGIRAGIFPSAGPITIPLASSSVVRSLARKAGIPVIDKSILFVINSEQDLPRVFLDVQNFSRAVNGIEELVSPELLEAMQAWVASSPASNSLSSESFIEITSRSGFGVFDRHIQLTPGMLTAISLLNDVFIEWEPARFGIFAPAGPLTVVLRMSTPASIVARGLGIPSVDDCEVLFITSEDSARVALEQIRQLSAAIAEMLAAIPPSLSDLEEKPTSQK